MRIAFLQFNPLGRYPPLMNLIRAVARAGWTPRVGELVDGRNELETPADLRPFLAFSQPAGRSRWDRVSGKIGYVIRAFRLVVAGSADILVFTDAQMGWLFSLLAPLQRGKTVYIEYDAPTWLAGRKFFGQFFHRRMARRADVVVLPSRQRAANFAAAYGPRGKVVVAFNYPTRAEIVERSPARRGGGLWIYYQGSVVDDRIPQTLFQALARVPFVHLTIQGLRSVPDDGSYDRILGYVAAAGVADRVRFLPPLQAVENLREEASSHHLGLAFFSCRQDEANIQAMWGASNKVYQYLAYGLVPLFSTGEKDMIQGLDGLGIRCDMTDPESIAEALRQAKLRAEWLETASAQGKELVRSRWNFEEEFLQVLKPEFAALRS